MALAPISTDKPLYPQMPRPTQPTSTTAVPWSGGLVNSIAPQKPAPTGIAVPPPTAPASGPVAPWTGQPTDTGGQLTQNLGTPPGQFGPGNDLRFTQFAPVTASPGTQTQLQNAQNQVAGFSGFGPYQGNPNAGQVAGLQGQAQAYTQGANIPNFASIQSPDQSQALGLANRAGNIIGQGYQDYSGQALQNLQGAGNVGYGQAQNQLDLAAQAIPSGQLPRFQGIGLNQGGLNQQATDAQGRLLSGITNAPNRQQLAEQSLQLLAERLAPQQQAAERQQLQQEAAGGRIGSGMAADNIARVGNTYQQELAQQAAALANSTAGQQLADQLSQLGAAQSVGGQAFGQNLAGAQFGQSERNAGLNYAQQQQQAGLNTAAAREGLAAQQAGLAGNQFGQNLALANAYQGLGAQNQQQQLAQANANQALANQLFGYGQQGFQNQAQQQAFQAGQAGQQAQLGLAQGAQLQDLAGQLYGQGTTESQLGLGQQEANLAARQGVLGQLSGLQGQEFGQGQQNFQNLQSQQGYQNAVAQQALQNRIIQQQLQDQLLNSQFGRQLGAAGLGLEGANIYGQQAENAQAGAADLLGLTGYQQGYGQPGQQLPVAQPSDYQSQDIPLNSPFQFQPTAPNGYRWQNGQLVPFTPGLP